MILINGLKKEKEEEINKKNDNLKNEIIQSQILTDNVSKKLFKSVNVRNSLIKNKTIQSKEDIFGKSNNKIFEDLQNQQKEKYDQFLNEFNIFRDQIYEILNEISKKKKKK